MARAQLSIVAQAVQARGLLAVNLDAVRSGSNDIAFHAAVVIGSGDAFEPYEIADDAGKRRTFRDADDFFKQAGALSMLHSAQQLTVSNMELVAPKPFTGNIVTKNENLVLSMQKRKTTASAKLQILSTELALMNGDPTVAAAVVTERTAQRDSVAGLVAWLDAEITRINALLGVGAGD